MKLHVRRPLSIQAFEKLEDQSVVRLVNKREMEMTLDR